MRHTLLLLGLDGASWDILDSMIEEGHMPTLKSLKREGAWGRMNSTPIPLTTVAWASIQTGKNPGKHGIHGFLTHDGKTVNADDLDGVTFQEILENQGHSVFSLNVPLSYPYRLRNGVVIPHFLDAGKPEIYPSSLAHEVGFNQYTADFPSSQVCREERILGHYQMLEKNFKVIKELYKRDWDVFFYLFSQTDTILHLACYELLYERDSKERELVCKLYQLVDSSISWFLERAPENTDVLLFSDHGFTASPIIVYVNSILRNHGLSKVGLFGKASGNFLMPLYRVFQKALDMIRASKINDHLYRRITKLDLNHSICHFDEGRRGIWVRNGNEETINRIISALNGYGSYLQIHEREELIQGPYKEDFPALFVYPTSDEIYLVQKNERNVIREGARANHHNRRAFLLGYGPNIKSTQLSDLTVYDVAPTILHLMDCPIPSDMDGVILREMLVESLANKSATYTDAENEPTSRLRQDVADADEEIQKRLRDLGYL